jgi:putative transposase
VITQAKKTEERAWLSEVSHIPLQQSVTDWKQLSRTFSTPAHESGKVVRWGILNSRKEQIANRRDLGWRFFPEKWRCLFS